MKNSETRWKDYGEKLELRMSKLNELNKQKLRRQFEEGLKRLRKHMQMQFERQEAQEKEIEKEENSLKPM